MDPLIITSNAQLLCGFFIPHYVFSSIDGLNFLLLCNYNVDKIPLKISSFHKQMSLAWNLIYKHTVSQIFP